ncbi:signal peptidase II [Lachnospiraceae bacterium OttesenSCG-928-E19]|nr:signal peptidase II [Lachnospiraceae bacterium OttesenSCG-928-E19]
MIILCVGIMCVIFATDVVLKQRIEDTFLPGEKKEMLKGKIEVRKVHNYGFALNFLDKKPFIVKCVSACAGIIAAIYEIILLHKRGRHLEKLGGALLVGGAFSNMYDRIVRGYVVDYIGFQTKWKKCSRITYNIGDFAIFAGAILTALFSKRK